MRREAFQSSRGKRVLVISVTRLVITTLRREACISAAEVLRGHVCWSASFPDKRLCTWPPDIGSYSAASAYVFPPAPSIVLLNESHPMLQYLCTGLNCCMLHKSVMSHIR